jgi:hypothetical protein
VNLKLDTTTPGGQHFAQRILHCLLTVRHDVVGIVPIVDEDEEDSDSESGSSVGGLAIVEEKSEDSIPPEELGENFKPSDASLAALKQSLAAIAEALTASPRAQKIATLRKRAKAAVHEEATNASILVEIRKNVEEW